MSFTKIEGGTEFKERRKDSNRRVDTKTRVKVSGKGS